MSVAPLQKRLSENNRNNSCVGRVTGTTGNSMNTGMNTVFIPQSTTRDLLQQQQPRAPGSPDVVSLREGLGTSDGPTSPLL